MITTVEAVTWIHSDEKLLDSKEGIIQLVHVPLL